MRREGHPQVQWEMRGLQRPSCGGHAVLQLHHRRALHHPPLNDLHLRQHHLLAVLRRVQRGIVHRHNQKQSQNKVLPTQVTHTKKHRHACHQTLQCNQPHATRHEMHPSRTDPHRRPHPQTTQRKVLGSHSKPHGLDTHVDTLGPTKLATLTASEAARHGKFFFVVEWNWLSMLIYACRCVRVCLYTSVSNSEGERE